MSSREAQVAGVLAAHMFGLTTAPYGWCLCGGSFTRDSHDAHVAQALIAAGLVLTDEWVVEERVEWGVRTSNGEVRQRPSKESAEWLHAQGHEWVVKPTWKLVSRTVTTATKTTPWKASEGDANA